MDDHGAVLNIHVRRLHRLFVVNAKHVVVDHSDSRRESADQLLVPGNVDVLKLDAHLLRQLVEHHDVQAGLSGIAGGQDHSDAFVAEPLAIAHDARGPEIDVVEDGLGNATAFVGPMGGRVLCNLLETVLGDDGEVFLAQRRRVDIVVAGQDLHGDGPIGGRDEDGWRAGSSLGVSSGGLGRLVVEGGRHRVDGAVAHD